MIDTDQDDAGLEALFAGARADPPRASDALLARVEDDARRLQPRGTPAWRGWWRLLGGLPGMGGLVTATCVGFWLGVAPPDGVPDVAGQFMDEAVSVDQTAPDLSAFGWDSEEG
ncbi:hypothetical protein [Sulfitobacter alexandrii]|uniref:hypothetical protein n=1 Tax=Sulfitobacter alexandrii TaxID=1917485 RepID=UPI0012EB211B|nr:hypothetical protein [Sulfitobacter alexandrii]